MLEAWLSWVRDERRLAPPTVFKYHRQLEKLRGRVDRALEALEQEELRGYLVAAGGTPSTLAGRLAALRSFYGFLVRRGARSDDPTAGLDRPRLPRRLPRPLDGIEATFGRLDHRSRLAAILLRETGLRISELCTLYSPPPAPAVLVIRGKGGKDRVIPLTELARATLDELGGRVDVSPRTIQRRFRAAGFTPHQLRHTFGCELAAGGADLGEIQDLMGHSSPATTRVYTAYGLDRLRRALDRRPR